MTVLFWLALSLLLLLALGVLAIAWWQSHFRLLRGQAQRKIRELWRLVELIQDPVRQVLEADKVLDAALALQGYRGSLGEKLKKAGPRLRNLDAVWRAHKLRNILAHEPHATVDANQAASALAAFRAALQTLGM